jgi:hypothetical protein
VNRSASSNGHAVRPPVVSTGLLPALLLSLVACGSPSSPSGGPPTASDPNGVPPAELCAFLRGTLPGLKQEPSRFAAMMTESSQISHFYQDRHALQAMGGVDLDATTKKACPAVRTAVLSATGAKTLNSLRGSG